MQLVFLVYELLAMGIVLGILMFMVLVLLHELGHFISAKRSGVKVLEFGIGIPPKVLTLRTDKSGTQYTLNLLPLGGFVKLKGENPNDKEEFNAPDSFISARLPRKVLILVAGVAMNFLLAWLLFTFIFWQGTRPISILPENALKTNSQSYLMPTISFLQEQGFTSGDIVSSSPLVESILSDGIAYKMGIREGDTILSVNGEKTNVITIGNVLKSYIGQPIAVEYSRDGKILTANGLCAEEDCVLGIAFTLSGNFGISQIKFPLGRAMYAGLQEIGAETKLTLNALGSLGKNLFSFNRTKINTALNKLTGPVGAVIIGDMLLKEEGGWKLYLGFAGLISLALALFNIIPLPALDGGRLLGVLIQWIGKLKAEKYFTIESYINVVFFVLLLILGVYIILKDLVRFGDVKIPFLS